MKILPQEYTANRFQNANQARAYTRAMEMKADHEALVRDVLALDNQPGIDFNQDKGLVVLNEAKLPEASVSSTGGPGEQPMAEVLAKKIFSAPSSIRRGATGELQTTEDGKTTYNFENGGNQMSAEISHGFLGLGQERTVLTSHQSGRGSYEIATFFADGSIAFKTEFPSLGVG